MEKFKGDKRMNDETVREIEALCQYLLALTKASEVGVKTFSEIRRVISKLEDLTK